MSFDNQGHQYDPNNPYGQNYNEAQFDNYQYDERYAEQYENTYNQDYQQNYQEQQNYQQADYNYNQNQQYAMPQPIAQQYTQQPFIPKQTYNQDYIREFQQSATGQIGMKLGTQALNSAQEHISSNVSRYFDINQWRYYFDVSNSYVFRKLQLIVFPFLHKGWSRTLNDVGYAPPRNDLNSPDLYIPVMAFVTYSIIVGWTSGMKAAANKAFQPEILGLTASTAFFVLFTEVLFIRLGFYFLNVTAEVGFLDLISYTGYKFIPINVVVLVKHFGTTMMATMAFGYLFLAFVFFTLRSLRYILIPDAGTSSISNELVGLARKRRVMYLFLLAGIQVITSWLLI